MTYPVILERPKDLAGVSRRLAALQGKGAVLGGGLEIFDPSAAMQSSLPEILIPMRQYAETSYIEIRGQTIRLGASTTVAEIAESMGIRRIAWPLSEAAAAVGSPQIRAQATVVGNLLQRPRCWYFRNGFPCYKNGGQLCPAETGDNRHHAIFDGGPTYSVFHSDIALALHALQASVVVVSPDATERIVLIQDLYTDPKKDVTREHILKPGEIIREVQVPGLTDRFTGTFMKIRERGSFDFAIVSVAVIYNNFHGRFEGMKIFLGGVSPRPYVPKKTIEALQFKKLKRVLLVPAADLAADGAQPLSQNAYKIPLVKNLVRRALETTYDRLSWKPD